MYRKWKGLSVLGMAALIGCLMPNGTMLAAEENTGNVQEAGADSVSGNTVLNADVNADDGISLLAEPENEPESEPVTRDGPESAAVPVIDIRWQGQSQIYSLGGTVEYKYVKSFNQSFDCSANQDGQAGSLSYCLDKVTDMEAEAKKEEDMGDLTWSGEQASPVNVILLNEGSYVLYVKAVGAGQTTYARSGGIVVDTKAPVVKGVEEGKSYPEGTVFQIEDDYLESVTINEKPVAISSDGNYQVAANGTSCVIKAKDKAGNDMTCSITVSGRDPGQEGNIISQTGRYALKAGDEYKLAEGSWKVYGDSTVYRGGSTFYVKAAGEYMFMKE